MKIIKSFAVFVLSFLFVTCIFAQQKQYTDVYLCKPEGKSIMIDENLCVQDTNITYEKRMNYCESLANKYIGVNKQGEYTFNDYQKEFKDMTGLKIGDEFYLSTGKTTSKNKVNGYKLWFNGVMGYEFNPILEVNSPIIEDTIDYDRNIFICSKYENISKINFDCVEDSNVIKNITAFLKDFTKGVKSNIDYDSEPVIKVILGNFLNTDKNEYAVSYCRRIDFDKYVSGVFIVNEIGKVAKTVVQFSEDFTYSKLLGLVDYNGDGEFELLIESGYYEGSGYGLYKMNGDTYEAIAGGFYWGA